MVFATRLFSLCCLAESVQQQSSHIQATVGAHGEIAFDSSDEKLNLDTNTKSKLSLHHRLEADMLHFSVEHDGKSIIFDQMQEYHLFGEKGFQIFNENDTVTYAKPSFRSFHAKAGQPYARVHVRDDGDLTGWTHLGGKLVHLQQQPGADATATLIELENQFETTIHTPMISKKGPKEVESDEEEKEMERELESVSDEVIDYDDGKMCEDPLTDEKIFCRVAVDSIATDGSDAHKAAGQLDLLQLDIFDDKPADPNWGGVKWYGGGQCYPGDDKLHVMKLGVMVDEAGMEDPKGWSQRSYTYKNNNWVDEIAHQFEMANAIYTNQMNIELQVGFTLACKGDCPSFMSKTSSMCHKTGITDQLNAVKDFFQGDNKQYNVDYNNVASTHLFTGCNPSGFGTIGLAWVGTLCRNGMGGVNHINTGWATFAHELGHNFNGDHSFEEGQQQTGGIMDYGVGHNILKPIQFNSKYRRTAVCGEVAKATKICSSTAFSGSGGGGGGGGGGSPTPPPAPVRRRRAPPSGNAKCCAGGGACDKKDTGIRFRNGQTATCEKLSEYCASYDSVKRACPATCNACGGPRPRPSPSPPSPPPSGCIKPGTVGFCKPCRESSQCSQGMFCCPRLKQCQRRGQGCGGPWAQCSPTCHSADCTSCRPSDGSSYANWGSKTCKADASDACCAGGSPCDKTKTNIKRSGKEAKCSEIRSFCGRYGFVRAACPSTCGECGRLLLAAVSDNHTVALDGMYEVEELEELVGEKLE
jgi:hypothetical protein